MTVAIIRLSSLGDVVLSAVFLPFLKERYRVTIHWFIDETFAPLLKNCPCLDVLHALPYKKTLHSKNPLKIWRFYKSLHHLGIFDLVIDMQGLIKSALLGFFLRKKKFIGFDRQSIRESLASLFYSHTVNIAYQQHILKRNQKILQEAFNLLYPPCNWQDCLQNRQQAFFCPPYPPLDFTKKDSQKVLFVLETSRPNKTYPLECFYTLGLALKEYALEIWLLAHKQREQAKKLYEKLSPHLPTQLLPPLTLDQIKSVMIQMSVVVGGDTGIVHLSWALNIPSVTLYGNTPPERFKLEGEGHVYLCANSKANYDKKDFSIQEIPPIAIKEAILQVLERKV
ncbi:lipopolysaccharide heptosyltransferase I [Helicobacter suis]|uniref:lipopolysaccharide heptosyltransferase I n=1 Tax=Helicobacter suis TaxID=104628 RepID=UPI0013D88CC5|nr:lipopolysaccharide heptosyltransferase I [Helicobacter suis]